MKFVLHLIKFYLSFEKEKERNEKSDSQKIPYYSNTAKLETSISEMTTKEKNTYVYQLGIRRKFAII